LRFLRILVSREDHIAEYLNEDYCGVDKFIVHMMDLEQGYAHSNNKQRNAPDVAYGDQLEIYAELAKDDDYLFYGAHDPFRLDPSFQRAEDAIEAGAAGLKFYPPSGYRPTNMEIPARPKASWCWLPFWQPLACAQARQWDSRYGGLSNRKKRDEWASVICSQSDPNCLKTLSDEEFFDQMNLAFFRRAVDKDWKVFSHHTPVGFEAKKGYGLLFADPCHWGQLLQSNSKLKQMKLVLAHSGGNGWGWQCDKDSEDYWCPDGDGAYQEAYLNFWKHAYNVCVTFENVFCDLGYLDAVLNPRGKSILRDRLEKLAADEQEPFDRELSEELSGGARDFCEFDGLAPAKYSIFDKLIYGSDWMMVAKEKDMKKLPTAFQEVFSGELEQYRSRFFESNANKLIQEP
jgi:hypothetical protein